MENCSTTLAYISSETYIVIKNTDVISVNVDILYLNISICEIDLSSRLYIIIFFIKF